MHLPKTIARACSSFGLVLLIGASGVYYAVGQTNTFPSSGNAGVGTTSPSNPLVVVGGANSYSSVVQNPAAAGSSFGLLVDAGGNSSDYSVRIRQRTGGAELFAVRGDGYVGIGTTSPDSTLHVVNGPAMSGGWNRSLNLHATYPVAVFNSAASRWAGIGYDYSTAMRFWVNATSNDVPGTGLNALTILNGGNVGIGTGNPATSLDVNGATRIGSVSSGHGILTLKSTSNDKYAYINFGADAGYGWQIGKDINSGGLGGANGLYIYDFVNSATRMAFNTNGNVGIGTVTPGYKLDVNGEINATGFRINGTPISGGGGSQWSGSGPIYYTGGNVGIGTSSPITKLHVGGSDISVDADHGIRRAGDNWIIGYSSGLPGITIGSGSPNDQIILSSGGYERMRIAANGKVGIGTTSPGQTLDVRSADYTRIQAMAGAANGYGLLTATTDGSYSSYSEFGSFGSSYSGTLFGQSVANWSFLYSAGASSNGLAIGTNNSKPLILGTVNAERLRIDASGNVGIGRTDPSYKLDVYGPSGNYPGKVGSPDGYLLFGPANAGWSHFITDRPRFYFNTAVTVDSGNIGSYDEDLNLQTSGTTRLTINNSTGNVGVGAAPSSYKLSVNGEIDATGIRINGTPISTGGSSQWSGSGSIFYNGGNVGIGTGNPGAGLDITSSAPWSAGWANNLRLTGVTYPALRFYATAANKTAMIGNNNDGGLWFGINGTGDALGSYGMVIQPTGNVGIGTQTPGANLDVNGPIRNSAANGFSIGNDSGQNRVLTSGTTFQFLTNGNAAAATQVGALAITSAYSNTPPTNGLYVEGKAGIGVTDPGSYKLNVNGSTNVTGNLNITAGADGPGNIVAAGTIFAKYQDVAEWVPSSEQLSAGTVVVLDSTKSNQVTSSSQSYDTRVAGVISAQPGIALGEKSDSKVLVATTGRVKVKVDASKGPIHIGDLLVTSDVPGVAMKSQEIDLGGVKIHRPGTLIGKALEPLEKGKGEILVLLSLQ